MSALFVFAADLHLCDRLWVGRPGIFGDAYFSFEQIIDHCIAQRLPLILGGDILDKERNFARPIQVLCRQMDRMAEVQLPVYFIQGQHERNYDATWLGVHPWPQHVHKQQFDIAGCKIYALDWSPRNEIQDSLAAVPADTEILICHQVWKDLMGNIGRPECAIADVHHVKDVLTGDFHVTTIVEGNNADGHRTRLVSPGSTCLRSVNEAADKHFYEIHRADKDSSGADLFEYVTCNIKTRPLKAYVVNSQADLDSLCCGQLLQDINAMAVGLPENIGKPVVRIKYVASLQDAYLRLSTAIGEAAHLFCDPIVEKNRAAPKSVNTATDLVSAVVEILGDDTPHAEIARALLSVEDPAAEIERRFTRFQTKEDASATAESRS